MQAKVIIILIAILLIFALWIQMGLSQEEEKAELETSEITRKLDEILVNQAEILEQIEQMKQELAIIKVRSSR